MASVLRSLHWHEVGDVDTDDRGGTPRTAPTKKREPSGHLILNEIILIV